ncbi:MAG: tetratricopeptide repeat protein [Alphaproteobacteria bacterium]|nr:tetratricopeptide repeat protein [Alphaproteobacteria bacterium]
MKWLKKNKCAKCEKGCAGCHKENGCSSCHKEEGCSECKKYQDKAFELEVDEELQQERLIQFWKKYRLLVYTGVTAILLSTIGFEWYAAHRIRVRLKESDAFENASLLEYDGKNAEAISAFEALAKTSQTDYRILALMHSADLKIQMNQKGEALSTLKEILTTTSSKDVLHLVTALTYVGYQLSDGNPDELLKVLEPALQDASFQGLATELAVPLLNKQGNHKKALELIQLAIQNPSTSVNSKARLNALKGE